MNNNTKRVIDLFPDVVNRTDGTQLVILPNKRIGNEIGKEYNSTTARVFFRQYSHMDGELEKFRLRLELSGGNIFYNFPMTDVPGFIRCMCDYAIARRISRDLLCGPGLEDDWRCGKTDYNRTKTGRNLPFEYICSNIRTIHRTYTAEQLENV